MCSSMLVPIVKYRSMLMRAIPFTRSEGLMHFISFVHADSQQMMRALINTAIELDLYSRSLEVGGGASGRV